MTPPAPYTLIALLEVWFLDYTPIRRGFRAYPVRERIPQALANHAPTLTLEVFNRFVETDPTRVYIRAKTWP
ncbi:hypothetical protein BH20PSE1_BH20PSE1_27300 [soil metagenome]